MRLKTLILITLCALLVPGCQPAAGANGPTGLGRALTREETMARLEAECQAPAAADQAWVLNRRLTRGQAISLFLALNDVPTSGLPESDAAELRGLISVIQITLFDFTYFPGPENHMQLTLKGDRGQGVLAWDFVNKRGHTIGEQGNINPRALRAIVDFMHERDC